MKTRTLYVMILSSVFVVLCIYGCGSKENDEQAPNIIVILLDDLGYGDISLYDENNKIKTPNIDRIGTGGIRFTDAHTPSAVCTPTRYGLLTGRYNWRTRLKNGVLTGKSKALIPSSRTTLASMLKKKDYHTGFIGKWHLGWDWAMKINDDTTGVGWDERDFNIIDFAGPITNTPNDLGFDYSYGHSGSLDMAPYVYVENGKATALPDKTTVNTGDYSWWRKGPTSPDFVHEDVTPNFIRRSISFIQNNSKKDNPFFLYLALPSPHTPILPTEEWKDKSGLNPYGDFVMMIDNYIGQMLATLKNEGIEDNTLFILTSDNGCSPEANFEELIAKGHNPSSIYRGHKADIYEGGHRVPFMIRWPDKIKEPMVSKKTICLTDILATLADITGYDLADDEGEDSYSLVPLFTIDKSDSFLREATVHHSINGSFAIRQEDWKLIMCPGSGGWSFPRPNNKEAIDTLPKIQLYNLAEDPGETINLEAQNPDIVNQLKEILITYINNGRSTPGTAQQNDSIGFEWKQISQFDL